MTSTSRSGHGLGQDTLRILLVAACLRPALTSVGPVLPAIGSDLGLGTTALGLLGALPLLCFAATSPLVHGLTRRSGTERAMLVALGGLTLAVLVRSLPVPAALWIGTALAACATAVGNVVVPAVVKRDFRRPARITGAYVAVMGVSAALASGLSTPLADRLGGWRPGLAAWALPTAVAAGAWALTRGRRSPLDHETAPPTAAPPTAAGTSPWTSALGWQVTAFMGLQSLTFYLLVTWLPSMGVAAGATPATAGWYLFAYQAVGVVTGPLVAGLADRAGAPRALWAGPGALLAVAALAALIAPGPILMWVLLAGAASGASFVLALAAVPLRTHSPEATVRLSGMAQSVGYLLAAVGPAAAGWIAAGRGGWALVVVLIAAAALGQAAVGLTVSGRDHRHGRTPLASAQDGPRTTTAPEEHPVIVCIPVTDDGLVGPGWGRAARVALAEVQGGEITAWDEVDVRWDLAHDEGTEGSHHARVARFVRERGVGTVVADHMGPPMANMLGKLKIVTVLGAQGPARDAVLQAVAAGTPSA